MVDRAEFLVQIKESTSVDDLLVYLEGQELNIYLREDRSTDGKLLKRLDNGLVFFDEGPRTGSFHIIDYDNKLRYSVHI